jgi:hypothetical protein
MRTLGAPAAARGTVNLHSIACRQLSPNGRLVPSKGVGRGKTFTTSAGWERKRYCRAGWERKKLTADQLANCVRNFRANGSSHSPAYQIGPWVIACRLFKIDRGCCRERAHLQAGFRWLPEWRSSSLAPRVVIALRELERTSSCISWSARAPKPPTPLCGYEPPGQARTGVPPRCVMESCANSNSDQREYSGTSVTSTPTQIACSPPPRSTPLIGLTSS